MSRTGGGSPHAAFEGRGSTTSRCKPSGRATVNKPMRSRTTSSSTSMPESYSRFTSAWKPSRQNAIRETLATHVYRMTSSKETELRAPN